MSKVVRFSHGAFVLAGRTGGRSSMLECSLVSIVAETGRLDSESSLSSVCVGSLDGGCWEESGGAEGMAVLGTEEMTDESSAGSGWASGDEHFWGRDVVL